jgi:hypothetical protein
MSHAPACFEPTRQEAAQRFEQLEQYSDNCALILLDPKGGPVEITDAKLRAMCDEGEVTLSPATYRLVYDQ